MKLRFINFASVLLALATAQASLPLPFGFFKSGALASGISPAAQAALDDWVARVQGQSSDVTSAGTQTAVGLFIDGLMTDSVWSKILRLNIYAGDGSNALKAPLKNTIGNTTDTLNGTLTSYAQNVGVIGNGTTFYVSTGVIPTNTNLGDYDMHFGLYVRPTADNSSTITGGSFNTGQNFDIAVAYGGTTYLESGPISLNFTDYQGGGFYIMSRTSSSSMIGWKNGTNAVSSSSSSQARNAYEVVIHARNNIGVITDRTVRPIEMYSIGTGLTATDVTNYTARYSTLRTALGR